MSPEIRNYEPYLGPRSRQGRFTLAIGVTLVLLTVTAGMLWKNIEEGAKEREPEITPVGSPTPVVWSEEALVDQPLEI